MTSSHSRLFVASALALAVANAFAGQITLYERPDLQGRSLVANDGIALVQGQGFGNTASSLVVVDGIWQVCTDANFNGRCAELPPGSYPGIDATLNGRIASVRQIGYADRPRPEAIAPQPYPNPVAIAPQPYPNPVAIAPRAYPNPVAIAPRAYPNPVAIAPQPYPNRVPSVVNPPLVTGRALLYEEPNFGGAWVAFDRGEANDLDWAHFTNPRQRAASIRVETGTFLFCTDMAFQGECLVLGPGEYAQLPGPLVTGISSARPVGYPEYSAKDVYRR